MARIDNKILLAGIILLLGIVVWRVFLTPEGLAVAGVTGGTQVSGGVTTQCTEGTGWTLQLAVQNALNPAIEYQSVGVAVVDASGNPITTGTTNGGSALSYKSLTTNTCSARTGKIYVLGDTSYNSYAVDYDVSKGVQMIVKGSNSSRPVMKFFDTTYGSLTANGTGITEGQNPATLFGYKIETTSQTMGQGDVVEGVLQAKIVSSNTQFGSDYFGDEAVIYAVDLVNLAKYSTANGFVMSVKSAPAGFRFKQIACPASVVSNANARVCYASTPIKTGGTYEFNVLLKADVGNPSSSDSPLVYVIDKALFLNPATNTYIADYFDSAGTDKGQTNGLFKIVVA